MEAAFFNAWAFAPADVNGDGFLDVVWGADAASSGCSVPGVGCVADTTVNDGDLRVWYGKGDGTFEMTSYYVSGVLHNAGTLLADLGTDTGSVTAGDVDGDGDTDLVAGSAEGIKVLLNNAGTFVVAPFTPGGVVVDPAVLTDPLTGIYYSPTSTQNSPWGLAFGDLDADGDLDLWVGDRALYIYRYVNDGAGSFTLVPAGIPPIPTRPNAYLRHDTYRAAVGFTPSLASADVNGDGRADLFVGLHSGGQTPAACGTGNPPCPNDGAVILHVSSASTHTTLGVLADLGR